ncbi:BRCA1-associated protein 2-domain-containing protein [Spinellus fusiger]|nr:BRCA1-associated protein 2-domain-containing protein [Spinellus fusiger]
MVEARGPMGRIETTHLGHGILHLYRDTHETPVDSALEHINDRTTLCTLAVPSAMATCDFLQFVAPVDPFVSHYRVLRDVSPNKYMVLMKFRHANAAEDYYKQYNGRRFHSMQPEICHVVYVSVSVDCFVIPATAHHTTDASLSPMATAIAPVPAAPIDTIELPTCPVCLERMDETVTGLLTIQCQHTFHCSCLSKWGDGSCPVCRYSQKPLGLQSLGSSATTMPEGESTTCMVCGVEEHLWICVICGHVGCGRYQEAHAYDHYTETHHLYALEIETQRVWDYVGDGYVHRLIQNMVDGKLVELPSATGPSSEDPSQDKLHAMTVEYTHLLTSQLESQRMYYETHLEQLTGQLSHLSCQLSDLKTDLTRVQQEKEDDQRKTLETAAALATETKAREKAIRKAEACKERMEGMKKEWQEERELTTSLVSNNSLLKTELEQHKDSIKELKDQVRDLMFFLEARDKVQETDMDGGSLSTRIRKTKGKSKGH